MSKQQQGNYEEVINYLKCELHTDNNPINQPKGTHRFALNAVNKNGEIRNENSNLRSTLFPMGFTPIGDEYIGDNISAVILVNPETKAQEIGYIDKRGVYISIVNTQVLGLDARHQCDIVYRLRGGNSKVIYWVDGKNKARTFNFTKPYDFYTADYTDYLRANGNPDTYPADKWDVTSFDLIKSYTKIPFFSTIKILETGSILPGSYNFAIQYVDQDLNPTEWVTTTNTVNIYNDSAGNAYERIRGSRNSNTQAQSFARASKSIRLNINNLDGNFPFYRVAVIQANGQNGVANKALASELYSTQDGVFTYTGNDSELTEVNLADILIDKEVIFAPQHIEQLENRLILSHTKGKDVDWCAFQQFASKITTDLVTKPVTLNDISSAPNVKNANSTFTIAGYMPGEVYSWAVNYLFDDGYISPGFHIPGKNIVNTTSKMMYHEIDSKYLQIHDCVTNNYWGKDATGADLTGKRTRHHRFPFRKDVGKPLVTTVTSSTTPVLRYRLRIAVSLNPSWTPGPIEYPSTDGTPNEIPFTFTYKVLGSSDTETYSSVITEGNVTLQTPVILYDDLLQLTVVSGSDYAILDPSCALASFQTVGNERFLLGVMYEKYEVTSTGSLDTNEVFGITFSNIQKPHPNVVGFYITRNERLDDDRIIVDSAIIGPNTKSQQYRAFGLLSPKQYYAVNNCGRVGNPNKTLQYENASAWFFSPEYHYLQNNIDFDRVVVEGVYTEDTIDMPQECFGGPSNPFSKGGGTKGVYIQDVQAGTSFNPDVNKGKDNDGFDLVIGYRNINVKYAPSSLTLPSKKKLIRLNAAAYQDFESITYYNVSTDNKISMLLFGEVIPDMSIFYNPTTKKNGFVYALLVRDNTASYSNFLSRTYYKEHNNPILFGVEDTVNNVEIFNGDVHVSATNLVSTVFYDMVVAVRSKKSKIWQIVVGSILLIGTVVAAVVTGGLGTPLVALAISYSVSLIASGIKFEQFKNMLETDYAKGLKECVTDGGVYETVRDSIGTADDTIRWFADRVSNIYMETRIPMGLRAGLTSGSSDFTDAPAKYIESEFQSYLTEKLTVLDRDQKAGRLYKGFAAAEFYDINKDYLRFNKEKEFIHLPLEFDCCSPDGEVFPMRSWYSEQSFQEELVDNYRVFLPNNYKDIEGETGAITDLYRLGNNLFIHTKESLWQLPASTQERVTGEIISFVGTGNFFNLPAKKIIDDDKSSGGTQHKWGTIKTPYGVFFISETEHKLYLHGQRPENLTRGNVSFFEENLVAFLSGQIYSKFGVDFAGDNNPANRNGIGYISVFDAQNNRIIFTKRDYLLLPDKIAALELVNTIPTGGTNFVYCNEDGNFYQGTIIIYLDNPIYFENKSLTMSFSMYNRQWVSWHSYLPLYYIHAQRSFYSCVAGISAAWRHDRVGHFQTFYDLYYPYIVEIVKLNNPLNSFVFEALTIQTKARKYDFTVQDFLDIRFTTFNKVIGYNDRQSSGEIVMRVRDTQTPSSDWYENQLKKTVSEIIITRRERDWNISGLRDFVTSYDFPMFNRSWATLKDNYYIDKVVNPNAVSFTKNWFELESFRDKYIIIRLKFDNFDTIDLALNYTIQTEQVTNQ